MKRFTPQEDQFIRNNYMTIPVKRMMKMLGRAETSGRQRLQRLGIVVPTEIAKKFQEQTCFKRGHVSHNTGKKQIDYMTKDAIKKTAATRFKKGNKPHNTCEKNGIIRIRTDKKYGIKYKYIKLGDANWVELHRYNWQNKFGSIPKGMNVVFIDRNSMNCDIENLELITNQELMERNSIHRYPAPVKSAIRTLNKLQKQIKQKA